MKGLNHNTNIADTSNTDSITSQKKNTINSSSVNPNHVNSSSSQKSNGTNGSSGSESVSSSNNLKTTAQQLYKDIREILSKPEFEYFAKNINKLNQGTQSSEETLDNIQKVLKSTSLINRLKQLMEQAKESQS